MPSGHAQQTAYSLMFIYLCLKNKSIFTYYLIITLITFYQRYKYRNHTILQIIVGAIVGILSGLIIFYMSQQNIKGLLKLKPDNNAPL